MDFNNKVLTIENREYLVIADGEYDGKQYLYLVDNKNEKKVMIREVVVENNEIYLDSIDNNPHRDEIFDLFIKKFSDEN